MKITIKTKDGTEIKYVDNNSMYTMYDLIQLIQQLWESQSKTTDQPVVGAD